MRCIENPGVGLAWDVTELGEGIRGQPGGADM
jgi:hypothetical protein